MKKINVRLEKAINMVKGKVKVLTEKFEVAGPTGPDINKYYILMEVRDEMYQIRDAE